jgi:hypothetical protein
LPENVTFIFITTSIPISADAIPTSTLTTIPTSVPTFILTLALTSILTLTLTLIPTFVLTSFYTFTPTSFYTFTPTLTILIVSAPALAELTLPLTPEMAALSPVTCILIEPQVQPQTLLTTCRNC